MSVQDLHTTAALQSNEQENRGRRTRPSSSFRRAQWAGQGRDDLGRRRQGGGWSNCLCTWWEVVDAGVLTRDGGCRQCGKGIVAETRATARIGRRPCRRSHIPLPRSRAEHRSEPACPLAAVGMSGNQKAAIA